MRGIGNRASQWLFEAKSPAKPRHLRRNGPVRVQFPYLDPDCLRSRRMNPAARRHIPVLGRQAIEMLQPRDGGVYVDATFGAGGYIAGILNLARTPLVRIDRDRSPVASWLRPADRSDGRPTLVGGPLSHLSGVSGAP